MRFWRAALPNLTIALNLALMIVIYLDMRNPMMGFLIGTPFVVLVAFCCVCSIASAIVLYISWRRMKQKNAAQSETIQ
jgi:protein-S-isoprenylcysteine O-methyltransferase Ste14